MQDTFSEAGFGIRKAEQWYKGRVWAGLLHGLKICGVREVISWLRDSLYGGMIGSWNGMILSLVTRGGWVNGFYDVGGDVV